jgi:hypothetical protein
VGELKHIQAVGFAIRNSLCTKQHSSYLIPTAAVLSRCFIRFISEETRNLLLDHSIAVVFRIHYVGYEVLTAVVMTEFCLLGYNSVQSSECQSAFRRNRNIDWLFIGLHCIFKKEIKLLSTWIAPSCYRIINPAMKLHFPVRKYIPAANKIRPSGCGWPFVNTDPCVQEILLDYIFIIYHNEITSEMLVDSLHWLLLCIFVNIARKKSSN